MKKLFTIISLCVSLLSANNLQTIPQNSYYTNANLSQEYNKLLAYQETNKLIKVIDKLLNNSKFKQYSELEEMTEVKVYTTTLLEQLKYFLNGWPKYTNTYFDNNSDLAGIKKILKDNIDNNPDLNIPQNIVNDMKKSISTLQFFKLANKIENSNHKNTKDILKNINLLMKSYANTLSNINIHILKKFNPQIKDNLEKNYRIYAKASLIKTIQIFSHLINQNYQAIKNEL